MKKNKALLHDRLLISRVRQYLEENVDKRYLDVSVMTKHLQERYIEYSRRKLAPFRALVEEAYSIVSQSYDLESQPSSRAESDGSDLELMDESSNNVMSNMMKNLYGKVKTNTSSNTADSAKAGEAIDISSDESGDESTANGKIPKDADSETTEKGVRAATISKVTNSETTSKGSSSSNSTTVDKGQPTPNVTLTQVRGSQKRPDEISNEQPAKKHKTDESLVRIRLLQSQQQQTNSTRFSNFQNVSEPGAYPSSAGSGNSNSARPRKYKKEVQLRKSRETFQDVGGMEKTLKELCELLMHIKTPDIYFVLGLMPPRGILLHGPPGCGKTLLARAIAGQLNLPLIEIAATELIAGISGESEERIRDVFEQAAVWAPCVLFIDEIDAISSNRIMAQKDMERRIVSQLISSMDNLKMDESGQAVLVVGATTRPDVLDPALRRSGRFDHEIAIGIPNRKDRKDILAIICDELSVEPKIDFDKIAELTPGYVGADMLALVTRAASIAVKRKCAEQIHDFQANRNITIVDLDADDGDETGEDKTPKSKKEQNKEHEPAKTSDNNPSKIAVEKESLEKAEGREEKQADEAQAGKDKPIKENGAKAASNVIKENVTSARAEDGIESNSKESNKTDGIACIAQTEKPDVEVGEPSLFELLNWLDNPPEDTSYASDFCITIDDFLQAVKVVQPSAQREGFVTVPDVTWDDIGSLHDIREELKLAVLVPVKFPEKMKTLGLTGPSGVLLCGPPGCGKTLLAKAIANEAGINFISVKGPELLNMYVGESERAVRACFQRARNSAPCVIFFDEFDSLCPKRSDNSDNSSGTRIVNQLLTEMDGIEERRGVYILAASNRPDIIDPAILRPGRLDTILYVGLPEKNERLEILKAQTKHGKRPLLASDVDFGTLAEKTEGFSGADLAGLVRHASMLALKDSIQNSSTNDNDLLVRGEHFDLAFKLMRPSVSAQDRKIYEKLRLKYASACKPVSNNI